MTPRDCRAEADTLLSLEFGCSAGSIDRDENTLTVSAMHPGARAYFDEAPFFRMACAGGGALITADERLHPFLLEWMRGRMGHWLFEMPNLLPLLAELRRYGYALTDAWHLYLPGGTQENPPACPVRRMDRTELTEYSADARFPNAFSHDRRRPDTRAFCAEENGAVMGIAACAADAPVFRQIGVDVLPKYRGRGIGTALVYRLTEQILADGLIPLYGTSGSNVHSQRIALHCGFRPAWVEISAVRTLE